MPLKSILTLLVLMGLGLRFDVGELLLDEPHLGNKKMALVAAVIERLGRLLLGHIVEHVVAGSGKQRHAVLQADLRLHHLSLLFNVG